MKTSSMCSSIFQVPHKRIHSLTNIWWQQVGHSKTGIDGYTSTALFSCSCDPVEGPRRRLSRRAAPTKSDVRRKSTLSISAPKVTPGISGGYITSSDVTATGSTNLQLQQVQHSDLHGQIPENKDLAKDVAFFVMDIETTGFDRKAERIIEIAIRDLRGGKNSTFQTLVNPGCTVTNWYVHKITTPMVMRPDVPRMEKLIPILKRYIKSRQSGGHAVFITHNGRSFDIPFLIAEFRRCSYDIPPDWLFLDTLPLAREAMKNGNGSKPPSRINLPALGKYYDIPLMGQAHRAMADVNLLAMVFQKLTFDLKLLTPTIIERCFRASDVNY